jgi:O-antigen ligase
MTMRAEQLRGRPGADPIMRVLGALAVVAVGVVLGLQYVTPDKRVLNVLAALVVFGIAWRLDMVTGLCLLVVLLPYPRGTVFGSTDLAFILLLVIIWLLRIGQRQSQPPRPTPVDAPLGAWLVCWVISFYNVTTMDGLSQALPNMVQFVACLLLFYLIVNNVRTGRDLKRLHLFQAISILTICLIAVYELNHPGGALVRGWIDFQGTTGDELNRHNVRVGGPFFDFELFSEFCALCIPLVAFMIVRTRAVYARGALFGLLGLLVFTLFAAVTRGAIISLGVSAVYLVFLLRRRVRIVPLTLVGGSAVATFFLANFVVSQFTRSGNLIARLGQTEFVGLVPDDRVGAWLDGWNRFLEHPIIGHGPYYGAMTGAHVWTWPHNGYLFVANYVGALGLACFVWLLIRLLQLSYPADADLSGPSYARSFLVIAHMQIVLFMVDQMKIDYLRNGIYQFEVWVMFGSLVAAYQVARSERHDARPRPALPLAA